MIEPRIDDDRLDLLLLARIGDGVKVGASDLRKSVTPFVSHALSAADIKQRVEARLATLVAAGDITDKPLAITSAGDERLRLAFGLAKRPHWKAVTTSLVPARALGLEATSAHAKTAPGLVAAVLARRIGVDSPPTTPAAVVDAWIADKLGFARDLVKASSIRKMVLTQLGAGRGKDVEQLAARLAAAEVRAPKTGAGPLRAALVQQWLSTAVPPPQQHAAPHTAPAHTHADTHEQPLPTLASAIRAAASRLRTADEGRFGRKVFIAALWRSLTGDPRFAELSLDRFKQLLIAANRDGLLELTRADLVAAMDPALVAASEIEDLGSTFHFVTGDAIGG